MSSPEDLFDRVEKPARYAGLEVNAVVKPDAAARVALCFPDVYEIGMSHLGLKILYSVVNAEADLAAERCFAPWPDYATALRENGRALATLETSTPLRDCDLVGFSLQYELGYTSVLEMIDLGGIPIHADQRTVNDPYVVGGGPCAFNPEPMAAFLDAFLIGDGEEALTEMLRVASRGRREARARHDVLADLAAIDGVYVPALCGTREERFTTVVDKTVPKRTLRNLDRFPFPAATVVANVPPTHDRAAVEIMRGCPQRCRFCQAGVIYRPTRFRDPSSVLESALESLRCTGYDEVGLCSLSSGDYPYLEAVSEILMERVGAKKTSLSLSSLRASAVNENLSFQVSRGRRTGFTIAPEAGSQQLRDRISKNLTEETILKGCADAFSAGWSSLKLYFMIGLPGETEEDVRAILDLAAKIVRAHRGKGVTVSASSFVPKPHTPFQWVGQDPIEVLREKQELLRAGLRRLPGVRFKYHDVEMSLVEALISRGDRRVGAVIEEAWRRGQYLDGWSEHFRFETWRAAIEAAGIDTLRYTGPIPLGEPLPWDHVGTVFSKDELRSEWERAMAGVTTPSCLDVACADCRACSTRESDALRLKRVTIDASVGIGASGGAVVDSGLGMSQHPSGVSADYADSADSGGRAEGLPTARPRLTAPIQTLRPESASSAKSADSGELCRRPGLTAKPAGGPFIYRGLYEKSGSSRFLSHLDLGYALRMTFRRSQLPLAYTEGYAPLPKLSYGPPLPLGIAGRREVIDFGLIEELPPEAVMEALNATLPRGLRFTRLYRLTGLRSHIARDIVAAIYETVPTGGPLAATPGALAEDRRAIRGAREINGRVYLLVHPEARADAVFEAATGQRRARREFTRTALVLAGEHWEALLPDFETALPVAALQSS